MRSNSLEIIQLDKVIDSWVTAGTVTASMLGTAAVEDGRP